MMPPNCARVSGGAASTRRKPTIANMPRVHAAFLICPVLLACGVVAAGSGALRLAPACCLERRYVLQPFGLQRLQIEIQVLFDKGGQAAVQPGVQVMVPGGESLPGEVAFVKEKFGGHGSL